MINLTIISMFRNSEKYIERYFKQINSLDKKQYNIKLLLGFGDCTDNTEQLLTQHTKGYRYKLIDISHGGNDYGSVVHPQRFLQLAYCANILFENVRNSADVVLYVESDLIWNNTTIDKLVSHIYNDRLTMVAPLVMLDRKGYPPYSFYDTWAFRANGTEFNMRPPYHDILSGGLIKVDSVGSCFAMNPVIPRYYHVPSKDVVVGLCNKLRGDGFDIYLDQSLSVTHE